ncbi:MAG: ABC transporter substrate-binding protein [Cloacibacillus porcorum]|uniref:ABC transporter substrate-binding protein n=1 Tax=Cloacibacillus porcorum TaxID=1197717 RepID=UPI00235664EA|nr:ABC transporter substrate-binding protein [Cloacibacillus porcorum]MCI5865125.1 ABC transporter substrate-binding protein [Cloacibacillus porcorum]
MKEWRKSLLLVIVIALSVCCCLAGAADAAKRDDIIVGVDSDIAGLDPFGQNATMQNICTLLVYDTLLRIDPVSGKIVPGLAESYEIVSPKEYIFTLRKGVKFHDGTPLKASDVKFSIERAAKSAGFAAKVSFIDKVVPINDNKVKFVLKQPSTTILNALAFCGTSVMSEEFLKKNNGKFVNNGTGPFKFIKWNSGDSIIVERNDNYWGPKPKIKTLKFVIMPENTARAIALETGEIDINNSVQGIDVPSIKKNTRLAITESQSAMVDFFTVNTTKKPFDNLKVRKALAYAINKPEMIAVLLEGRGTPRNTILAKTQNYADETLLGYKQDVATAKKLLAEAGYKDGFSAAYTTNSQRGLTLGQVLQAQLAEIGVKITIERMERGAFNELIKQNGLVMTIDDWAAATSDADNPLRSLLYSKHAGTTNRMWYQDAKYDAMLDEAVTITDPKKAQAAYSKIQKYIEDNVALVPLFSETQTVAADKNIGGLVIPKGGEMPYYLVYWK